MEGDHITNIGSAGTVHTGSVSNTSNTNNTITNVTNYITYGTEGGAATSIKPLDHIVHRLFLKAAKIGNAAGAAKALEDGAYVDFADAAKRTALFWAVQKDSDELAKVLVEHGADLDDPNAVPYATHALDGGKTQVALFLLEKVDKAGQIKTWLADGKEEEVAELASHSKELARFIGALGPKLQKKHPSIAKACVRIASRHSGEGARTSYAHSIMTKCYGNTGPHEDSWTKAHLGALTGNLHGVQKRELSLQDSLGNTPLHWAVLADNERAIETLIQQRANKEARNKAGETPLHLAARVGHLTAAKALLKAGVNFEPADSAGQTPLDLAVLNERVDLISFLLDHQAKERAAGDSLLELAAAHGKIASVRRLLSEGVSVSSAAIDRAAQGGHENIIRVFVEFKQAPPSVLSSSLKRIVKAGHLKGARTLLSAKAPLDPSLLASAIHIQHLGLVELLSARGCGPKTVGRALKTQNLKILQTVLQAGAEKNVHSLAEAIHIGWCEGAWALLQEGVELPDLARGEPLKVVFIPHFVGGVARVRPDTIVENPLLPAIKGKHLELAGALLKAGAPPSGLVLASTLGPVEMIELLIKYQADANQRDGTTSPLEAAAASGHLGIVRVLVNHGAELTGKALDMAAEKGHAEIVDTLLTLKRWSSSELSRALEISVKNDKISVVQTLVNAGVEVEEDSAILNDALQCQNLELLEMLLAAGFKPTSETLLLAFALPRWPNGALVLMEAGARLSAPTPQHEWVQEAYSKKDLRMLRALFGAGVKPETLAYGQGYPLLSTAVYFNDIKMVNFLIDYKCDPNCRYDDPPFGARTVLEGAVLRCSPKMVTVLLRAGARPAPGALHRAAISGHVELTQILVDAGARPEGNLKDSIPRDVASRRHLQILNIFLKTEWIDCKSFLFYAISGEWHEGALVLMEAGARLHIQHPRQSFQIGKLVEEAYADGNARMLRALFASGAFPEMADKYLLHRAVKEGNLEMVKLFIECKANVQAVDYKEGGTPLNRIRFVKDVDSGREIVRLLLAAGAKDTPIYVDGQKKLTRDLAPQMFD